MSAYLIFQDAEFGMIRLGFNAWFGGDIWWDRIKKAAMENSITARIP